MPANELYQQILQHDVISFDIFDTLLERAFHTPSDLFYYIEAVEDEAGFANARIAAERQAFAQNSKNDRKIYEVTFDQIYNIIDKRYSHLKKKELFYEQKTITATQFGKSLYNYAVSQGKDIVVVSDTYLDEKFIENILETRGYTKYNRLFVSSSHNKTKRDGNLFSLVSEYLGNSLNEVLHIGDNPHADVLRAAQAGIHSALYISDAKNDYLWRSDRLRKLLRTVQGQDADQYSKLSILTAISSRCPLNMQENGFWAQIGFHFAGPMVVGFAQWIKQYAQNIGADHVMFLARDGHLIRQAFAKLAPNQPHSYHFLNRAVVKQLKSDPALKKAYSEHLENLGIDRQKILMIDVGSVNFTTQRFLKGLELDIHGGYWITGCDNRELSYRSYFAETTTINEQNDLLRGCGIVEFFMSAPIAPIVGISEKEDAFEPLFQSVAHHHEVRRIEMLKAIEIGFQIFLDVYMKKIGEMNPIFTAKDIVNWVNLLLHSPTTEEKKEFMRVYHASDDAHSLYVRQFPNFRSLIFKKILIYIKDLINVR